MFEEIADIAKLALMEELVELVEIRLDSASAVSCLFYHSFHPATRVSIKTASDLKLAPKNVKIFFHL